MPVEVCGGAGAFEHGGEFVDEVGEALVERDCGVGAEEGSVDGDGGVRKLAEARVAFEQG